MREGVRTGTVNATCGSEPESCVSHQHWNEWEMGKETCTEVDPGKSVATRVISRSSEGMTCPDASRCESVVLPSSFGHTMIMSLSAIWVPKPLTLPPQISKNGTNDHEESATHSHPTNVSGFALQNVWRRIVKGKGW